MQPTDVVDSVPPALRRELLLKTLTHVTERSPFLLQVPLLCLPTVLHICPALPFPASHSDVLFATRREGKPEVESVRSNSHFFPRPSVDTVTAVVVCTPSVDTVPTFVCRYHPLCSLRKLYWRPLGGACGMRVTQAIQSSENGCHEAVADLLWKMGACVFEAGVRGTVRTGSQPPPPVCSTFYCIVCCMVPD